MSGIFTHSKLAGSFHNMLVRILHQYKTHFSFLILITFSYASADTVLADSALTEVQNKTFPSARPVKDVKANISEPSSKSDSEATTIAPNLDLKEVAPLPEPVAVPPKVETKKSEAKEDPLEKNKIESSVEKKIKPTTKSDEHIREKLVILGAEIPPNTSTRLSWSPRVSISGLTIPTPVLVINGKNPGPTVCLTSTIHGDELNGIEVVRRVMYDIKHENLNGVIIGVPIVNMQGFQRGSRYLSDRRDLNRYFPGYANGSLASRIANSLFTEIILHCNYLIDLHTGSFRRNNLPQIRANMRNEKIAKFVEGFDKIAVVHHPGNQGMLRTAANQAGITAITMELGESSRIQEDQIVAGTYAVNSVLDKLNIYSRMFIWGDPKPAYYESVWLRAESGGILFSEVDLGETVAKNDLLGIVTDPITNKQTELKSPVSGNVIGMAVNQVVIPGFAAYHIGIKSTKEEMIKTEINAEPLDSVENDESMDPE